MKKILIGVIIIMTIILIVLSYQNNEIKYGIKILTHNIFSISEPLEYNSLYKVNDLTISNCDYYYLTLDDFEKNIYTNIINSIKEYKTEVVIPEIKDKLKAEDINKKIQKVMNYIFLDHPEIYYVKPQYQIYISTNTLVDGIFLEIQYLYSKEEMLQKHKKINDKINSILSNISSNDLFQTEVQLHDYIAKNVDYLIYQDETNIHKKYHSIEGALLEEKAVCDGLSKTLQILLDNVGIESIFVTGLLDEVNHGWLMVKLENEWYNLDVTANKYINNENNVVQFVSHAYFNITTEELEKTHIIDKKEILPVANSMNNNYYKKKDLVLDINEPFSNKVVEIFTKQKNNEYVEFYTTYSKNVLSNIVKELYKTNYNDIKKLGNEIKLNYYLEGNTYIIKNY